MSDKFTFHGKTYEVDENGTNIRILTKDNVVAGNGIDITDDPNGDGIIVETDLGLSISGGQLCMTFEKEV
jgi:hypothetical protein